MEDLKLENEELWALIDDVLCLLETIDPEEKEPGVKHWLKRTESLIMAKHRRSLHYAQGGSD